MHLKKAKNYFKKQIKSLGSIIGGKYHYSTILNKSKNGTISNLENKSVPIPNNLNYQYIINPINGKEIFVHSKLGNKIITKYRNLI